MCVLCKDILFNRITVETVCSTFLGDIKAAFVKKPDLANLLFDDFFRSAVLNSQVCQM